MKHLLVVYHTKTGTTARLAEAVIAGVQHEDIEGIELRILLAKDAGPDDLLWADGLLIGTPENFGYMSGAMKDFLDRTFYEVEGQLQPLPYGLFISAGNDGRGAVSSIKRIGKGYPFVEVQTPIIINGEPTSIDLARCEELGMSLAAGLSAGIY